MTEKPRRPSAEIRADIAAAEARHDEISQRIDAARAEIARLQEESTKLLYNGYKYSTGVIPDLQRELGTTLIQEEFATGLPVVWESRPSCDNRDYVVVNVTAKSIFVRVIEPCRFDFRYRIDGHAPHACSPPPKIDIQATFGVPEITAKLWAEMKGGKADATTG